MSTKERNLGVSEFAALGGRTLPGQPAAPIRGEDFQLRKEEAREIRASLKRGCRAAVR